MAQPLTAEEAYKACEHDLFEAHAIARSRADDEYRRVLGIEITRRWARRIDVGDLPPFVEKAS